MLIHLLEWLAYPPIWFGAIIFFLLFSFVVTAFLWLLITQVFTPGLETVEPDPVPETNSYEFNPIVPALPPVVDSKGMELITYDKVATLTNKPTPTVLTAKKKERAEPIRRWSDREKVHYRNPDNIDFKISK